jgi:ribosomal protein L30/L7E
MCRGKGFEIFRKETKVIKDMVKKVQEVGTI